MSSAHDPLRDVDPWDYIRKRKEYQDRSEIEKFFSVLYGSPQAITRIDYSKIPSYYELESGQLLRNVHAQEICEGRPCAIHHASKHPLSTSVRSWYNGMIYRICEHSVQHPDYDALVYLLDRDGAAHVHHVCCVSRCCGIPERVEIDG